ncbi:MAG: family ATPase [Sediminibacterium sp.]|nr:family ATPase [Sediminibacterium sp.]
MSEIEKNEMFDLAYRFVTETNENIFLTGKAGTGKTTFLKYLQNNCTKNIITAAPTGVAAINAGGVTLHSLFQLPFHPFLPTVNHKQELLGKLKYNRQRQDLLRKMELLVIDEISMVRADTMDAIDTILRSLRRNYKVPFGGVQILCIGDLHQLPPVAQQQEWAVLQEYYESPFFFDSLAVKEQMPLLLELNTIYRQKEEFFVSLLNKVRNNQMNGSDFEDLHTRYLPGFLPEREDNFITLTSHNKQADQINELELEKLHASKFIFSAEIEGDFSESAFPAEKELVLKEGAQVMFLKNDGIGKQYFNGKIGVVQSLEDDKIIVDCNGKEIEVNKDTWENNRYVLNREDGKLEQQTLGTFTQYPLRLAWAITIHKSQGLTFEKLMIDAAAAFSSGQVYVALSRCTSLDGIVLLSKIPSSAIMSNSNVVKAHQSLSHKGSLEERFAGAREIFTQQLLEEIFSFHGLPGIIETLGFHVIEHAEKLNKEAKPWLDEMQILCIEIKKVGSTFVSKAIASLKEIPIIEEHTALQQRISDAANWFLPKLLEIKKKLENHPIVTEHKETATVINEDLQNFLAETLYTIYAIDYCRNPFSVTGFLQHKLNFAKPKLNITSYAGSKKITNDISGSENELLQSLKRWRNHVIEETGLPVYLVANAKSLAEIATYLPLTKKDLMQIAGFGKAKVDKYGAEIIEMVEDYCSRNDLSTNMEAFVINPAKAPKKPKEEKTNTKLISFELYKSGKTIAEIAKERNYTYSTIEGHLAHFVGSGDLNIDDLISHEKQELIKEAITKYGNESLTIVKQNLPDEISFGEIRMVNAGIKTEN